MRIAIVVVLLAGCGRFGFGEMPGVDADPNDDAPIDVAPDAAGADTLFYLAFDDDPADGRIDDTSNHGFDALCVAGLTCPTHVPGVRGMGVQFDGSTQYALIPYQPALTTTALTVAVWVYLDTQVDQVAIGKPVGPAQADSWALVAWKDARLETCFETTNNDAAEWACMPQILPLATWFHLAGTWDGTTKRLYVNGVQVGSIAGPGLDQDTHDVVLGADQNSGVAVYHWHGRLDEVRVYDRALMTSEIMVLATP